MRIRPGIWFLISLLLFAAAAVFWRLGENERLRSTDNGSAVSAPVLPKKATPAVPAPASSVPPSAEPSTQPPPEKPKAEAPSEKKLYPYRLSNTSKGVQRLARSANAVLLNNALIDTSLRKAVPIPAHLRAQGEPGSYIVQSRGMIDSAFLQQLQRAGAQIISYLPHNAYLVKLEAAGARQLESLGRVQSVLPWEPYYKVEAALLPYAVEEKPMPAGGRLRLTLLPGERETAVRAMAQIGAPVLGEDRSPFGPQLIVQPPLDALPALARLAVVQGVERDLDPRPLNDLSRVRVGVSSNSTTTANYLGLSGSNVLVAVIDTPVDPTHPDLTNRVFTGANTGTVDTDGHGTFVAGIIGSGGTNGPPVDAIGSVAGANYRGMAPQVNLLSFNYQTPGAAGSTSLEQSYNGVRNVSTVGYALLQEHAATSNLFIFGRTNRTLIANYSWGAAGGYNSAAASYDMAVRDSVAGLPGSQPVAYVFAAGNGGAGGGSGQGGTSDTIDSPAAAKNVITVGAIENERDSVPGNDPGKTKGITNIITRTNVDFGFTNVTQVAEWQGITDSSNEVAAFSGRGNVGVLQEGAFGRFKPDVVAPGTFPVSTRSANWINPWDYPVTNSQTATNIILNPGQTNSSAVFIFNNATNLTISVQSSLAPPFGLLIYTNLDANPSSSSANLAGTNSFSTPVDANLQGQSLNYDIVNTNSVAIAYNVRVQQILTNNNGDYFIVLSNLNLTLTNYYRYDVAGTSFSAPVVSGLLALMQQFFEEMLPVSLRRTNSPAMMKALLINGSRSVSANYGLQVTNFLNLQGWGLPNLPTIIPEIMSTENDATKWPVQFFDQSETNALATGERHLRNVAVTGTALSAPLRVTLVWTDPPGNPNAAVKLVNDLNLIVSNNVSGEVYFGNAFPGGGDFSSINGVTNVTLDATNIVNSVADTVNNVENVYINGPLSNSYTVIVEGYRVNVNATPERTNSIGQDYALVISTGAGGTNFVPGSLTVQQTPTRITNSAPNVIYLSGSTNQVLMNQRVGANVPLITTTNGTTNQWTFYVITDSGVGTNGIFATFLPPNASRPRNASADIDLYVSTDSNLTNLNDTTIANCFAGINGKCSTNRGGTEIVKFTNNVAGTTYYVGVKSEDQQSADYGFFAAFTDQTTARRNDSDGSVDIFPIGIPAGGQEIPDGSPDEPGMTNFFAINPEYPITIRRVVVTNYSMTHENFGDVMTILSHEGIESVLQNHGYPIGLFPDIGGTITDVVYDDSDEEDIVGSQPSEGIPNLQVFNGQEGLGLWMLTAVDNQLNHTGVINNFAIHLDPNSTNNTAGGGTSGSTGTNTVQDGAVYQTAINVPANAASLTISVRIVTPPGGGPLDLFVRRGTPPDVTASPEVYDHYALISDPGASLTITLASTPPLSAGIYFIAIRNNSGAAVDFVLSWEMQIDLAATAPTTYANTSGTIILDNALTNSWNSSINVGFSFSSSVTNIALTSFVATLTTDGPHNFTVGDRVALTGMVAPFTGTVTVFSVPTSDSFTFVVDNPDVASQSAAGTATLNNAVRDVTGVRVGVRIDHPRAADLVLHLVAPSGKRVLLAENRGNLWASGYGMGTNANELAYATFSDDADVAPKAVKYAAEPAFLDFINPTAVATNYLEDTTWSVTNGTASGGQTDSRWLIPLNPAAGGTLSVDWNFYVAPDDLRVYDSTGTAVATTGSANNSALARNFDTADVTPASGTITISAGHPYAVGDRVSFTDGGLGLPGGLIERQRYYVVAVAGNDFQVSTTAGGTPLTFTSAGGNGNIVWGWQNTSYAFPLGSTFLQIVVNENSTASAGTVWDYVFDVTPAPAAQGPSRQFATGVAIQGANLYLVGVTEALATNGIVARFGLPLQSNSVPVYSLDWPNKRGGHQFSGIAASSTTDNGVYAVGRNYSLTTDPDLTPSKQDKGIAVKFPLLTPLDNAFGPDGQIWYQQVPATNDPGVGGFPDGGLEELRAVTVKVESGSPYVYVTGNGETNPSPGRMLLAKLDENGAIIWAVNDAVSGVSNYSSGRAITSFGTNVFVAGVTNDGTADCASLLAFDEGGASVWSLFGVAGQFNGITTFNGELFVVGQYHDTVGGVTNFLVERYTTNGTAVWSQTGYSAGPESALNGVVAYGDRLYAVGYSRNGAVKQAVLLEIDQATGALIARSGGYTGYTTHNSGFGDDAFNAVATDGLDLYVVGEGKRSANPADAMVLRYRIKNDYLPEEPLTSMIGEQANGDWQLEIWDNREGGTNTTARLLGWQLQFNLSSTNGAAYRLANAVVITNTLRANDVAYFIIDAPFAASQAVHDLINIATTGTGSLTLAFDQTGLPSVGNSTTYNILTTTSGSQTLTSYSTTPSFIPGQRYYLSVRNTNAGETNTFSLKVTFDNTATTFAAHSLSISDSQPPPSTANNLYQFNVSATDPGFQFQVKNLAGNVAVRLRRGALPTSATYDFSANFSTTNLDQIVVATNASRPYIGGTWYASVENLGPGGASYEIVVKDINAAPVITPIANQSVNEGETLTLTVTAQDNNNPPDNLTFSLLAPPAGAGINPTSGVFSWTPSKGQGAASYPIQVVVTDDGAPSLSATNTFTVTVNQVNYPPAVAVPGAQTVVEDVGLAINGVSVSDVDAGSGTLRVSLWATNGWLTVATPDGLVIVEGTSGATTNLVLAGTLSVLNTALGGLSYQGAQNFNGSDVLTVVADDLGNTGAGGAKSGMNSVAITVTPVNDAPVANGQGVTTAEDTAVGITLTGSDVENEPLTYRVVSGPTHGSLSGTAPNLTYLPVANYHGGDSFTFKVNDGTVDSSVATVTVTVTPVNDAPVASAQSVTTAEDVAVGITLAGGDADNNPLTYAVVNGPSHGSLSGTVPNLTYLPGTNYNGGDSFTFKVNDGIVDSETATVTITVTPVNDAPVANSQSVTTAEDTAVGITLTGGDVDNNPLTYTVVNGPSHGSLSGTVPNLTYLPGTNYNGGDSFTFKVNDGTVDSVLATVTITVTPVNDAPVANAQSVTTAEDTAVGITLTGGDVDNNPLTYTVVNGPSHGSLSGTVPNLTYLPGTNYNGGDSFTFKVNDGIVDSETATVTITVTPVNDAPVLTVPANQTMDEMTALSVTANAVDPDAGDVLNFTLESAPAGMTINPGTGAISWTPTEAQGPSTNTVTVKVTDNGSPALSDIKSFTVVVNEVNRAPVLTVPGDQTLDELTLLNVSASATDPDSPANVLTFALVAAPSGMTIDAATGAISWTPTEAQGPSANTVTVKVTDNGSPALSDTKSFTVTVRDVNSAPVFANMLDQTMNECDTLSLLIVASDNDVPANTLSYSLDAGAPAGAGIDPVTGMFTFANPVGPSTNVINVIATDNGTPSLSTTQAFTVTVKELATNVMDLAAGTATNGTTTVCNQFKNFYRFTITNGSTRALFELYDLDGSADLLLRRGNFPAAAVFDFAGMNSGLQAEQIVIQTNASWPDISGDWYLAVTNLESRPVKFSLRANVPEVVAGGTILTANSIALTSAPVMTVDATPQITWTTVIGEKYQVEVSTDLQNWTVLTDIIVTGPNSTFTDPTPYTGNTQRFYRIRQVPQ